MFALPHRHLSAEDEFFSVCFEAQRKQWEVEINFFSKKSNTLSMTTAEL
jgi:hypothetical protein